MKTLNKKVKLGAMLNLFFLIGTYFMCYDITPSEIPGMCKECSAESSLALAFATIILGIQGIVAVLMLYASLKIDKKHNIENVVAALLVNILLSFIQMTVMCETTLIATCHRVVTKSDVLKLKMFEQQFTTGKIVTILLVIFYFTMFLMITRRSTKPEEKTKAEAGLLLYP